MKMESWSASTELFSLILILILILYAREKKRFGLSYGRTYLACLYLSAATVGWSLLCAFCVMHRILVPVRVSRILIGIYYFAAPALGTLLIYHMFQIMLEYVYEKRRLKKAGTALAAAYLAYFLICAAGMEKGVFFSLDADGKYRIGRWGWTAYLFIGLELLYFLTGVWENRRSISRRMWHVIRILPPTVLLLGFYQLAFPELLLNGCVIVAVDLILMFHFVEKETETEHLTCINDRTGLYQELTLRLAGKQSFQAIAVGFDRYSSVNRNYGYEKGDRLLISCARWLQGMHPLGRAFRISNVTFVVLLPYHTSEMANENLSRVKERFGSSWEVDGAGILLRARVAEVIHRQEEWAAQDILDFLRFCLGKAAASEKRLVRLDEKICSQVKRNGKILQRLNQALEGTDIFEVWYQPIYDCRNEKFTQAEALIRLRGEKGEIISPGEFLPIAETAGLMEEIGLILIQKVCEFLGKRHAAGLMAVSINLTAQQLMSDQISACILESLQKFQIPASRLRIEITEGAVGEGMERVRGKMEQLSRAGIRFYLDDFGKGDSNLSRVLELPFACVKLDKCLIDGFPDRENANCVVTCVLKLFHEIESIVIAEGAETREQVEALKQSGADLIQGFWFAVPMPEQELLEFLRSGEKTDSFSGI